jgi:hypothetical protein
MKDYAKSEPSRRSCVPSIPLFAWVQLLFSINEFFLFVFSYEHKLCMLRTPIRRRNIGPRSKGAILDSLEIFPRVTGLAVAMIRF